jgi:hypothetical protein
MIRTTLLLITLLAVVATPALAGREGPPRGVTEVLKDLKGKDREARLAALDEARELQDKAISSQLLKMSKDRDLEVRLAAVDALRDRSAKADRLRAAQTLAGRLAALAGKVEHEEEYRLTISVLHDLAQPVAIRALLDLDVEEDPETARERLMAVANVPHADAIEGLIAFAAKGRKRGRNQQRQLAFQALRYATGQKFPADPDAWRSWWNEVKRDYDFTLAAARREELREKEREKLRRQEERRQRQEERQRQREEREADG